MSALLTKEAIGQKWPFDKPNGWDRDAARLLALIQMYPMMWLACTRAKYIELRVDTRDCGFGLRDRDGKPLSPDDIVKAIDELKARFGDDGDVAGREYREGSRPEKPLLAEMARLRQEKADAEADALRLHGEKMTYYHALLEMKCRDDQNGSLHENYRKIIDDALGATQQLVHVGEDGPHPGKRADCAACQQRAEEKA